MKKDEAICYICGSANYLEVLHKPSIAIWTNASDEEMNNRQKNECILYQCTDCGHIYQPVSSDLKVMLADIYSSSHGQLSTPVGIGNWGLERAKKIFNMLESATDLKKHKSAAEIGCANGCLLRYLKKKGLKKLLGIEPSLAKTEKTDGLLFLKDFANEHLQLPQKYDLIFSVGVFEHIQEINSVMRFCRNNLCLNGELFFSVPDVKRQLYSGDPALFSHQHVHYYTTESLAYLLAKHGFEIKSLLSREDSFNVCAKMFDVKEVRPNIVLNNDYQKKLDNVLEHIENILKRPNVIVHGANNALNNILGWLNKDFDFTLVDNDQTKHVKKYFNRIVRSLNDIVLSEYSAVVIIPTSFYEIIKADYIARRFHGRIESLMPEGIPERLSSL